MYAELIERLMIPINNSEDAVSSTKQGCSFVLIALLTKYSRVWKDGNYK